MELYEQIRREYEHGAGTIDVVLINRQAPGPPVSIRLNNVVVTRFPTRINHHTPHRRNVVLVSVLRTETGAWAGSPLKTKHAFNCDHSHPSLYVCLYGARWGRDSILFASSSFLKRSIVGSQYNLRFNTIAIS